MLAKTLKFPNILLIFRTQWENHQMFIFHRSYTMRSLSMFVFSLDSCQKGRLLSERGNIFSLLCFEWSLYNTWSLSTFWTISFCFGLICFSFTQRSHFPPLPPTVGKRLSFRKQLSDTRSESKRKTEEVRLLFLKYCGELLRKFTGWPQSFPFYSSRVTKPVEISVSVAVGTISSN